MTSVEMTIDSVRLSLINYQRTVILKEKGGERYLPIWIDAAQGDALAIELQNVTVSDPLPHYFVLSIINKLGAVLKYVIIYELKGETYRAKAILEREGRIEIDCRPSDAFAVAVRANAPIFVTEEILMKSGVTVSELGELDKGKDEA